MRGIRFNRILSRNMDRLFVIAEEIVRECVFYITQCSAGTGLVEPGALTAPVKMIAGAYRSGDIDGSSVQIGDERLIIRSKDLQLIPMPGPDDYLIEVLTGLRRNVIAARLDVTGTFWTIQARRSYGEDWESLSTASLFEDWQN
jgi:hypothetical protein